MLTLPFTNCRCAICEEAADLPPNRAVCEFDSFSDLDEDAATEQRRELMDEHRRRRRFYEDYILPLQAVCTDAPSVTPEIPTVPKQVTPDQPTVSSRGPLNDPFAFDMAPLLAILGE